MIIRIPNMHSQLIRWRVPRRAARATGSGIGAAGWLTGHGVGLGPREAAVIEQAVAVVEDVADDPVEGGAEDVV